MKRDYLGFADLSASEVHGILQRAGVLKSARAHAEPCRPLEGRTLALIFEKASTRTRVSFEVAMWELGGQVTCLEAAFTQLGRGEPARDTARVLSRYCHAIALRTFAHATLVEFARFATVPVINALTDFQHPCQVLADLQTVFERKGRIKGLRFAWIGDGNNVANSWMEAAALLEFDLRIACPPGFTPDEGIRARKGGRDRIHLVQRPDEAASGADVLVTDVWASMGQEAESEERHRAFRGFTLDEQLLEKAAPDCLVLHCLPAHRGEEITEAVLEGPHSAVFDEAENRLHTQKALLEWMLT